MWFEETNKIKINKSKKFVSKPQNLFNQTLNDDAKVLTFFKLHQLLEDDNHRSNQGQISRFLSFITVKVSVKFIDNQ